MNNFQDLLYGIFGIAYGDSAFIIKEADLFEVELSGLDEVNNLKLTGAELTNQIIEQIYRTALDNNDIDWERASLDCNSVVSSLYVDGEEVYSADDLRGSSAVDKAN